MKNKVILTVVCALMGALSSLAGIRPYAVYTSSDKTLTFYYGEYSPGYDVFIMNSGNDTPAWYYKGISDKVDRVVFDPSFADARVTTTCAWFTQMTNLTSIEGLEYLNTENVTNMYAMFAYCTKLTTLDLSSFDTRNVIVMTYMFYGAEALTSLNLSGFNTNEVERTDQMFYGCQSLTNLDLSNFNMEEVTTFESMFANCSSLTNLNLNSFNTKNAKNLNGMFKGCRSLTNLNLNGFNTGKVKSMDSMFNGCINLISIFVSDQWSTASVQSSDEMFYNCTKLKGGAGTTYDASHVDASYAHVDGGTSNPGYLTGIQPAVVYDASSKTLTFYYDGMAHSGDAGLIPSSNTTQPWWSQDSNISANVQKVVFDPSFSRYHPTSGFYWFANMANLTTIEGIENLNTDEMVNMQNMFRNCSKLTSLNLQYFNTVKVTSMYCMFMGCSSLASLDLGSFSTSAVTHMEYMFYGCINLTTINLAGFNTLNVTSMLDMFSNCNKLTTLDLSNFNTSKVTDMAGMFSGCSALTTILVGEGWSTAAVTESNSMFRNCTKIVGGQGTTYDASHIDKTYARVDGGISNPGYLTAGNRGYAMWDASQKRLTFYFDNLYNERSNPIFFINKGETTPGWHQAEIFYDVNWVMFDTSFANARPTSCYRWFSGMWDLYSIIGIENLNTSEVTTMSEMFYDCHDLTSLDLSNFDTSKLRSTFKMFSECNNLVTIVVSDKWNVKNVSNSFDMFYDCNSILGCKGTVYDPANTVKTYARIDEGPDRPGYLSDAKPRGFKYNGIWYDNSNGSEVSIIPPQHFDHYTGEVVIPSKFTFKRNNYTPHLVEAGAFTGSDVTSVDLPGSVVVIESGAFTDAPKLKKLVIEWNYSPDYIQIGQDFAGGNANGFACYVKNSFLTKYEETYVNINFAPWVQISETYYTELKPYRPFSCKYKTKLPAGLEAYYVKSYDNSTRTATATKVNGVLPANTGFLLKGNECKIYLLEKTGDNAITITGNMLKPRLSTDQPWNQSDGNAYFFFNVGEMNWGPTVNISQGESYLCIPKSQLGSDLTSPIKLDIEGGGLKGDVNGDGKVNVSDVSTLINMILGITPTDKTRADVNGDGKVNVSDVTALINIILGIN